MNRMNSRKNPSRNTRGKCLLLLLLSTIFLQTNYLGHSYKLPGAVKTGLNNTNNTSKPTKENSTLEKEKIFSYENEPNAKGIQSHTVVTPANIVWMVFNCLFN